MKQMSAELEEIVENTWKFRRILISVLPDEAVDYIINLIVEDLSYRKFLNLCNDES